METPEWMPTHEDVMALMLSVLSEEPVRSDALFIHGSFGVIELDDKEIRHAAELYRVGFYPKIILNGLTAEECRRMNLAYRGYEIFRRKLLEHGVQERNILLLKPSLHTGSEVENLVLFANAHGWKRITIMSYPHHQMRCFLHIVGAMQKYRVPLVVYNQSFRLEDVDWRRDITKTILNGKGDPVRGDLLRHVSAEFERIVKYGQKDGDVQTSQATTEEALAYLFQGRHM